MSELKKYFILSIDTEPDDSHWSELGNGPWPCENLKGLGIFADRMRNLNILPTYLVSHSVADSGILENILKRDLTNNACEIGAHFHPSDTPPFSQNKSIDNIIKVDTNLLEEKFSNLHSLLVSRFGAITSYRSGAWAMDSRVTALLKRFQYLVDSSVTPGVSWRWNGRPSYLSAPMTAYPLGDGNPSNPGQKSQKNIWEIPVSIHTSYRLAETILGKILGDFLTMPLAARKSVLAQIIRYLRPSPPQWLRPAFKNMVELEAVAARLEKSDAKYLHVMCHSNELWPGTSPYCKTLEDVNGLFVRLEGICQYALGRGYIPITLSAYAKILNS